MHKTEEKRESTVTCLRWQKWSKTSDQSA